MAIGSRRKAGIVINRRWGNSPQQANDILAPSDTLYDSGWDDSFTVNGGNKPKQETFNWLHEAETAVEADVNRHGASLPWDEEIDYEHEAVVTRNGRIHVSLDSPGVNIDPAAANNGKWSIGFQPDEFLSMIQNAQFTLHTDVGIRGDGSSGDPVRLITPVNPSHLGTIPVSGGGTGVTTLAALQALLGIGGGVVVLISTQNVSLDSDDNNALVVMGTGGGNRNLSLPSLDASHAGFLVRVAKNTSTNTLIIDPNGSDTIAGLSSYSLRRLWESVTIAWTGATWIVLSHRVNYGTNEGDVPRLGGGGRINLDTIPNLPADRTTNGEFDERRIPGLSADKIVRDVLPLDRGGLNADTAAGGRATLKLGTAAREDIGIDQDDVARVRTVAPAGIMGAYAGGVVPDGWLLADGRAISRTTYSDLYAAIGTTWGPGNGNTTFNLPDTQERFLLGKSATKAVGDTGGESEHTLTTGEMPRHSHSAPSHSHSISAHSHTISDHSHSYTDRSYASSTSISANVNVPGASSAAAINSLTSMTPSRSTDSNGPGSTDHGGPGSTNSASGGNTGNNGSGDPHNNMPPYAVVLYIIKT